MEVDLRLYFNYDDVEEYTQVLLSQWGIGTLEFTPDQIAQAWAQAVADHLERMAEDADCFLMHNGTERVFLEALLGV